MHVINIIKHLIITFLLHIAYTYVSVQLGSKCFNCWLSTNLHKLNYEHQHFRSSQPVIIYISAAAADAAVSRLHLHWCITFIIFIFPTTTSNSSSVLYSAALTSTESTDVTKLVKICIRRMWILTYKIRRMRMRMRIVAFIL